MSKVGNLVHGSAALTAALHILAVVCAMALQRLAMELQRLAVVCTMALQRLAMELHILAVVCTMALQSLAKELQRLAVVCTMALQRLAMELPRLAVVCSMALQRLAVALHRMPVELEGLAELHRGLRTVARTVLLDMSPILLVLNAIFLERGERVSGAFMNQWVRHPKAGGAGRSWGKVK
jgi:hypothetical protein